MRLSSAPALMRICAFITALTYGIFEAATWASGGPGSLRGPLLAIVSVSTVLGWTPVLVEARIRTVVSDEHRSLLETLLQALDERECSRDEEALQKQRRAEADHILRQRFAGPSNLVELRRTNGS